MAEVVKVLVDRKSADDVMVVFWKMDRCMMEIKSDEGGYREWLYSLLGRRA